MKKSFILKEFGQLVVFLCIHILIISCSSDSKRKNLVFISIDTLRADHLSCYGYKRNTSPNIDQLAAKSILFKKTYSHSPKTTPSHMSMFTSQFPTVHGVFMFDRRRGPLPYYLDDKIKTLAEILAQNGYSCVAFTGGGNVSKDYGFDKGFKIYDSTKNHWKKGIDWIKLNHRKKFFIFFHTYAVHDPYLPPDPYYSMFNPGYKGNIKRPTEKNHFEKTEAFWKSVNKEDPEDLKQLVALYDGAIRFMDERLMKPLLDTLSNLNLLDNTIVIFTSDHGEEFKEHGLFRHDQVYDELLNVPLIIYLPPDMTKGVKLAKKPSFQVRLIDLMPTVLDLLKTKHKKEDFQGTSLIPIIQGKEEKDRILYACRVISWSRDKPFIRNNVIRYKGFKLIHNLKKPDFQWEFYNVLDDPSEKVNLISSKKEKILELKKIMVEILRRNYRFKESRGYRSTLSTFNESTIEQLKALGYIK